MIKEIISHSDFLNKISKTGKTFLLLYKAESEQSQCALRNIADAQNGKTDSPVHSADVTIVRDIHPVYAIDSVPSLLLFDKGSFVNVIKGCHESSYYKALFENEVFKVKSANEGKTAKKVTVYSTPTCSWCNTLKAWLQKNNIRYSDIDVSQDQKAAEALILRSGQQGVPQTDINGQIVVGFNQPLLKQLLDI